MYVFRKMHVVENKKTMHIFDNMVTIDTDLKTEWATFRNIKLLRIPEKDLEIWIHPDETLHVIINK